jgi:hypothetical protein
VVSGDLDDSVVVLVGNQDVPVRQELSAVRVVELIESGPGRARRPALPDDLVLAIDLDDPSAD